VYEIAVPGYEYTSDYIGRKINITKFK